MVLMRQNDRVWSDDVMAQEENKYYTIGEYGCIITSVCNIVNMYKKYKPDERMLNPRELNKRLKDSSGYTESGEVIWAKLGEAIAAKIDPYFYLIDQRGMDNRYNYPNFNQNGVYYIARINSDTGYHFLQIIGHIHDTYIMFDTYDNRFVYKKQNEVKRIIEIRF